VIALAGTDGSALLKLVYTSVIAGLAGAVVFSLAVYGATRAGDMRRAGRPDRASGYAILGTVALVLSVAIVVVGLVFLTHKS
jgi:hypothetical protein